MVPRLERLERGYQYSEFLRPATIYPATWELHPLHRNPIEVKEKKGPLVVSVGLFEESMELPSKEGCARHDS